MLATLAKDTNIIINILSSCYCFSTTPSTSSSTTAPVLFWIRIRQRLRLRFIYPRLPSWHNDNRNAIYVQKKRSTRRSSVSRVRLAQQH